MHFGYTSLPRPDSIRLISIDPGSGDDHVSVRLLECSIGSAPQYDALSYVWGDTLNQRTISCDSSPISITQNLHWALRRVRHVHWPVAVWADAICINQEDIGERNAQVGMMGIIFGEARRVWLCIGDDPDGGAQDAAALVNGLSLLYKTGRIPFLQDEDPLQNDGRWKALVTLMDRPWFKRVWVIQEAGLAKDPRVLYGTAEFPYRELIRVLDWMKVQSWSTKFQVPGLLVHSRWSNWRQDNQYGHADKLDNTSFLDLLSHGAMLSCSDPRDYVYAFLGHPFARGPDGKPAIVLDYARSPEEIYLEVSILLMSHLGIRTLSLVEHTENTIVDKFPSWVVRWNVTVIMNDISRFPLQYQAGSKLSQPSTAGVRSDPIRGHVLNVRGVVLDTLQYCFRVECSDDIDGMKFHNVFTGHVLTLFDLIAILQEHPRVDKSDIKGLFLNAISTGGWEEAIDGNWLTGPNERLMFHANVEGICHGRTFIIGSNGYCGIAPLISKPGDVCCVLFGADVPFVLRPSRDCSSYRLLGEAYVHELMRGSVVSMLERGQVHAQDVVLY